MIVLQKGKMKDGTAIQIEDWNEDYSFMEYGSTIGTYPISKMGYDEQFTPKKGKTWRIQYNFKSNKEAKKVYNELINGVKTLKDIEDNLHDAKYKYKDCV